ncbi:MAG: mevalonate kinase [Halobacteriales archaeon]
MPASSAPGKVYLFGEHAVVYGEPAVPCAIERRARAEVKRRTDDRVSVAAPDLPFDTDRIEYSVHTDDVGAAPHALRYVAGAIDAACDACDTENQGFDVAIESELPIGAGLGSSAAVTVATLDATARACGTSLGPTTIADLAFGVELEAQDGQASRADTFCAATGGAVRVEGDDCRGIEAPELPFVIGYDGGSGDTAELVTGVRSLVEQYAFVADTIEAIGDLVRTGEELLARGDVSEVGRLMDVNHGLLSSLGVSGQSLDDMVWRAREAGAIGAKLTGAGGAGCIVALAEDDAIQKALAEAPACESAFPAGLDEVGVRPE